MLKFFFFIGCAFAAVPLMVYTYMLLISGTAGLMTGLVVGCIGAAIAFGMALSG